MYKRQEYDWLELWRSMLGVASFLAQRHEELVASDVQLVATSLLETLAVALVYSDRFLQTPAETHLLVYELARSAEGLQKVAALLPPRRGKINVHWALLQDILHAIDAKIAAWRERPSGASYFFSRTANKPPSTQTVMRIIQEMDLNALLGNDAPACAAILRTAQSRPRDGRRGAPSSGTPSPSAALLRCLQQDLLAQLS